MPLNAKKTIYSFKKLNEIRYNDKEVQMDKIYPYEIIDKEDKTYIKKLKLNFLCKRSKKCIYQFQHISMIIKEKVERIQ